MRGIRVGLVSSFVLLAACNDNSVVGMPGDIAVSPASLDFGRVQEQTDFEQTVILSNEGERVIEVTGIHIEPPGAAYALGADMPTPANPWRLLGGEFRPLEVHFVPTVPGAQTATVVVESNDPDEGWLELGLAGTGFHVQLDDFTQGQQVGGVADILFVVDNSGSMSDKQQKLGNSFNTFINWLVGKNVDYRIAITTTDMADPTHQGRFRSSGSYPKILTPTTPNVIDAFKANVNVGDTGSGDEQGLIAGLNALTEPLASTDNAGFLRPTARLFVVYVTDEEDSSPNNPQTYINGIAAVKNNDLSKVFFAAIAGPPPLGCFNFPTTADAGTRYKSMVDATTGLFASICDNDFGVALQNLAFEVTATSGDFPLTELPIAATIEVMVDGIPAIAGTQWVYLPGANVIHFQPGHEPTGGQLVQVTYEVQ